MGRKKVGLALASGAARGVAQVGVLTILEREGIPIDMIAGTSIGAIIGAFYAAGKDISQITDALMSLSRRRMVSLADWTIPTRGFIKGNRITHWLKSVVGDVDFTDLKMPFACVATDIMSGEEVVIKQGSVVEGVRASVSMPVIFTPAKWGGRYLVDGGLVNPIPVRVLRQMGADLVIAVNVVPYIGDRLQKTNTGDLENSKEPNIVSILIRIMYIMGHQAALAGLREADIVITPRVGHINPSSFNRAREGILHGERAARQAVPEIKRHLEI